MGNRIEVLAWVPAAPDAHLPGIVDYYDRQVYGGDSVLHALWSAWKWRGKCGRVRIDWRPR